MLRSPNLSSLEGIPVAEKQFDILILYGIQKLAELRSGLSLVKGRQVLFGAKSTSDD